MNSVNNMNKKSMAKFLMNENLEPATRTLDIVRLVFHFCNFVNLTLGGIAFGVGIGYDLTPINVSGSSAIKPVQTKFVVTGVFVIIHGLIGAYGFVSRQSRSLILYGCLGLCLLIVGSVAAWSAKTGENKIVSSSRQDFYFKWQEFDEKIDQSREGLTYSEENKQLSKDDQFIWNLICIRKSCHMTYISTSINRNETNLKDELNKAENQKYYNCKKPEVCTDVNSCDTRCDSNLETYNETLCEDLCNAHTNPLTCIKYVKILTRHRVVTMYVILFSLSVTQTVCLLCDILFIFWSLKEEVDIEIHHTDYKDRKRLSTKLQLLNRFLPCCFNIPQPSNNARQSNVALSDIFSTSEPDSSVNHAINTDSSADQIDVKT
ncbi:hypothetical protein ACHWQZ_G012672 [Mnemiopsis leidyi]